MACIEKYVNKGYLIYYTKLLVTEKKREFIRNCFTTITKMPLSPYK